MSKIDKPVFITRREFYSALVVLWLFIMLVLGVLMRLDSQWTTVVLFLAAMAIALGYIVQASRATPARGAGSKAALSERVKEIASDPSRKIEAIQAYREETGASLAAAKEEVDAFINSKQRPVSDLGG
jgi:ribosomal protein L7/L12